LDGTPTNKHSANHKQTKWKRDPGNCDYPAGLLASLSECCGVATTESQLASVAVGACTNINLNKSRPRMKESKYDYIKCLIQGAQLELHLQNSNNILLVLQLIKQQVEHDQTWEENVTRK
jgi:hypothetical protein